MGLRGDVFVHRGIEERAVQQKVARYHQRGNGTYETTSDMTGEQRVMEHEGKNCMAQRCADGEKMRYVFFSNVYHVIKATACVWSLQCRHVHYEPTAV